LGSLGNAITNGISNHALTLIALGAGIAQGETQANARSPFTILRPGMLF
jgi:hypothetical protein